MEPISLSDFFRLNGIEKPVEQERIQEMIGSRVPPEIWAQVRLTSAQAALLGKVHGYRVEEPPPRDEQGR